eukprot:GHVR01067488.1.p1 GENE.GHVR01067488.1~~GHVR01067488.1.p1  ORF type:complete len:111 (+),score=20.82 GHVR01067488.1:36-368(+)
MKLLVLSLSGVWIQVNAALPYPFGYTAGNPHAPAYGYGEHGYGCDQPVEMGHGFHSREPIGSGYNIMGYGAEPYGAAGLNAGFDAYGYGSPACGYYLPELPDFLGDDDNW